MTEKDRTEDHEQQEQPPLPGPTDVEPTEREEHDRLKETTEKIWGSTKSAWNTAAFKASQYKRLVQKKIDLSALHKKIGVTHADLGKLIDDLRETGTNDLMAQPEVQELLRNLDSFKAAAMVLEEEIENIKEEAPAQEDGPLEKPE